MATLLKVAEPLLLAGTTCRQTAKKLAVVVFSAWSNQPHLHVPAPGSPRKSALLGAASTEQGKRESRLSQTSQASQGKRESSFSQTGQVKEPEDPWVSVGLFSDVVVAGQ